MKIKYTFKSELIKGESKAVIEVTCNNAPMIYGGDQYYIIRPIEKYRIEENECSEDFEDDFTICPAYDKGVIIEINDKSRQFGLCLPEIIQNKN